MVIQRPPEPPEESTRSAALPVIRSVLSKDEKDCSFKAFLRCEYLTENAGVSQRLFAKGAVEPSVARRMS